MTAPAPVAQNGAASPAAPESPAPAALVAAVVALFFIWGGLTSLNDILIPKLKSLFSLSYTEAMLTQFAFFTAYFVVSLPAGHLIARVGYLNGIVAGLGLMAAGCLVFIPASGSGIYATFLVALFVLAAGITVLQVAANPLIANLGSAASSHSRLTLAQAFNSLGTTVFPPLGAMVILGSLATVDDGALGPAELARFRAAESAVIGHAYLGIAAILVLVALFFWARRRHLPVAGSQDVSMVGSFALLRRGRLAGGVASIFLYVGAEVSIGSALVNFLSQPGVMGLTAQAAGKMIAFYWGGAMVGRFAGAWILQRWSPGIVLALANVGAFVLVAIAATVAGAPAGWCLLAVGLMNSIMFPTIFSLGVEGLGERTPQGSGLLCMAIVGGALVPVVFGLVADAASLAAALAVPAICYACIALYGWSARRPAESLARGGAAIVTALAVGALAGLAPRPALAADAQPWLDPARPPDERAALAVKAMTLDEKISLLHGPMAITVSSSKRTYPIPKEAIPAAGYVPGIPRLGIPALYETDASLGVVNPFGQRPGDVATALPSSLVLAGTFDPKLAFAAGAMVGREARAKGFNVLLGGGVNLTRDPRNGRNFEYLGEDPLLAGTMAGEAVRGTQSEHVISTVKHFALNSHETNRMSLDARLEEAALRESDLLAFELALDRGQPGSVMCSYNLINGTYGCGHDRLLNGVLKGDWRFPGWVMSDWGAVHDTSYLVAGLDQQSGEQLDRQVWFGEPLKAAVQAGRVPVARVDDAVKRILRSMFAVGIVDRPPQRAEIDYKAHAAIALDVARKGIVLVRNEGGVLPFARDLRRVAVIGGHAHVGVLSGGGSSQVTPSNGAPTVVPVGGRGFSMQFRTQYYFPSPPLDAIEEATAEPTEVIYDAGMFPADAAALAASADVAIVFATRHELEGYDVPDLGLPAGQDALIEAVARANPKTVVVLETGNPVAMPWIDRVAGVLVAWYPGQEGGQAIADVLFGRVNPSGHLPMTFPAGGTDPIRPKLPNHGVEPGVRVAVDYIEGADVGYRWYARNGVKPLFPFGHGLSYTTFRYDNLRVTGDRALSVTFDVTNTGGRAGDDVPQVYLTSRPGVPATRLAGFERVSLQPGERRTVSLTVEPKVLASFDAAAQGWRVASGEYRVAVGHSAGDFVLSGGARLRGGLLRR